MNITATMGAADRYRTSYCSDRITGFTRMDRNIFKSPQTHQKPILPSKLNVSSDMTGNSIASGWYSVMVP
jgi:hypothetical protein